MNPYLDHIRKVVFSVVVERLVRYGVETYLMPLVHKIPVKRKNHFGFHV